MITLTEKEKKIWLNWKYEYYLGIDWWHNLTWKTKDSWFLASKCQQLVEAFSFSCLYFLPGISYFLCFDSRTGNYTRYFSQ